MSDPQNNSDSPDSDFTSLIHSLEQIVKTVPDDLVALEMLAHVYEQNDEHEKMRTSLLRLGELIVHNNDIHLAEYIHGRMHDVGLCENMGEDVSNLVDQLSLKISSSGEAALSAELLVDDLSTSFSVMDELEFAWRLFEAGELKQDVYSELATDMSDMTIVNHLSTISVLHALDARAFGGMERVMDFIARDTKVPIISLESFHIKEKVFNLLPLDFIIKRGAMVYDLIADDALVVVMNPVDSALRRLIESKLKKVCHYYVALPADFDAVIQSFSDNK